MFSKLNMKNSFIQEIIVSLVLIMLLILLLNPFHFWMPDAFLMMMIVGLIVVFALFAGLIWKENARDERENLHRMLAGRIAFLAGSASLVIGIIFQSFKHELDFWLVFTLSVMILAKIIGLIYSKLNH